MSIAYKGRNACHSDLQSLSGLFEVVAVLSQASQGSLALVEAVRRISHLLGAEATAICRVDLSAPQDAGKVFCHEARAQSSDYIDAINVSFAHGVIGRNIETAKVGSVWHGGLNDFADRLKLATVFKNRRLEETVVIPLQRENGYGDFLELHFSCPIPTTSLANFEYMGPVLVDCWKDRSLGMFSESLLSRRRVYPVAAASENILAMENPCRLSRAEFRVCLLLSRGLKNSAVLSELSITIATLRTHLRNIYAKTDSASQPELIHKLLSPPRTRATRPRDASFVA